MLLYSKQKNEIYDDLIHTKEQISEDAVPISKEEHEELIKPRPANRTSEERIQDNKELARLILLNDMDFVLSFIEVGESLPDKWIEYRRKLRAIANGLVIENLPERPE